MPESRRMTGHRSAIGGLVGEATMVKRWRHPKACDYGNLSEGLPMPESRRMTGHRSAIGGLVGEATMAKRWRHPSERRAGCPTRTSGDG
ncbi:MAG: hypothetical protein ACKO4T_13520, partial [Planctomycetaceae bacterium]